MHLCSRRRTRGSFALIVGVLEKAVISDDLKEFCSTPTNKNNNEDKKTQSNNKNLIMQNQKTIYQPNIRENYTKQVKT